MLSCGLAHRCLLFRSHRASSQDVSDPQQVFFPEGVRYDGKKLVGTGTTPPVFNYLNPISGEKKDLVDQTGIEPVTS
jgi:hypothetical protein